MEDLHRLIAEKCLLKYRQICKKRASCNSEWSPLAAVALVQKNSCTGNDSGNETDKIRVEIYTL